MASLYAGENEKLINNKKGWRIDLIAVTILTDIQNCGNKKSFNLNHYKNI